MDKKELKEMLEEWRQCNWVCCEDKKKGKKPCHFDQHGKDIVKSIMEFCEEDSYFEVKNNGKE